MIFSILTTLLAVLAVLALLPNVFVSEGFTAKPPQGEQAVGLVILVGLAIVSGLLLIAATASCAIAGGLGWTSAKPAVTFGVWAFVAIGVSVGAASALIHWAEPAYGRIGPGMILGGIVGPAVLAIVLVVSTWTPPGQQSAAFRASALVAVVTFAVIGFAIFGNWTAREAGRSMENSRRRIESDQAREAYWARKRSLPPIEVLREDFAAMSADAPLWPIIAGLPDTQDDAVRQFVIARALKVPGFEAELKGTLASHYARYRHASIDVLRFIAADHFKPAWRDELGQSIVITVQELGTQPAWLTDASLTNPNPPEHVRAIAEAAKRFGGLEEAVRTLRDTIAGQQPGPERDAALAVIDAAFP